MDKTKMNVVSNAQDSQTVNGSSTPGNYADDSPSTTPQPVTNVFIEGMTIATSFQHRHIAMVLQSCKNSHFKEIKITGPLDLAQLLTMLMLQLN